MPSAFADRYDSFLLDLDGVLYRGDEPIPGAGEVTERLRALGARLVFVTNNSSKTPHQVAEKLERMGVRASPDEVVTSALATAALVSRSGARSVYVIGETGIRTALAEAGIDVLEGEPDHADAVVVGWDRGVTYGQLRTAALLAQRGAALVATNADASYPAPDGAWPGAGAILAAITTTIGRPADVEVGKPQRPLFDSALERAGGARPLVVGDRLDTDVAGAAALGWDTLLVFTGVAGPADLLRAPNVPTYAARGISVLSGQVPPSIDPARAADADAIERLLRQSDLEPEEIRERLPVTFVAREDDGDAIAGTVALELFGPVAHLRSLAVEPNRRGAHLATLLCAHAAREARRRGARQIYAVTETAAGLFERLGFERTGTLGVLPEPLASTPLIRDRCSDRATVLRLELEPEPVAATDPDPGTPTTPEAVAAGPVAAGPVAPGGRAPIPSGRTAAPRSSR